VVTAERGAVTETLAACAGTCLARDLVNCPGGELTPPEFAHRVHRLAERDGLDCTVYEGPLLDKLGLAAVSRGSRQPARFVEVEYTPSAEPSALTVGLVGKGITFDSGGLSLKPSKGMRSMKADMGGAAAVVGALAALPGLGLPVRVRAYLPLAENMPDGDALRIGDVVRHADGTTTEIVNTDNEGRVVLADVLVHASRPGPRRADVVVDVATLTSAVAHALGTRAGALFSNDDRLADAVLKGAARAGTPWAHLDIAAAAFNEDGPYDEVPHGGTGFGVRTLVETLRLVSTGDPSAVINR
jgi:leucyl aminopeptidase